MKETLDIHDGKGILHLIGSPTEAIFYVKKEPRMACLFAEVGTVMRYHIGKEIDEDLLRDNYEYENMVKKGKINFNISLSKQFDHITKLMTNGSYSLHLCEFPYAFDILPAIEKEETKKYYDTYGGIAAMIATQTYLDKDVVENYKKIILNGVRPVVVLYKIEDSWAIFILDGHHKLKAYKELKIDPKALIISKLDYKNIQADEAITTMKGLGLDNSNLIRIYQEEKISKAYEQNFYKYYSQGLKTYFK